jgi:hypothetical protein
VIPNRRRLGVAAPDGYGRRRDHRARGSVAAEGRDRSLPYPYISLRSFLSFQQQAP